MSSVKNLFSDMYRFYQESFFGEDENLGSTQGDHIDETNVQTIEIGDELEENLVIFGNQIPRKRREDVAESTIVAELDPHKPQGGLQLFSRDGHNSKWKEEKKGLVREVEHFKKILKEQEARIESQKNEILENAQRSHSEAIQSHRRALDSLTQRLKFSKEEISRVREEYEKKISGLKDFTKKMKELHESEKVSLEEEIQSIKERSGGQSQEPGDYEKEGKRKYEEMMRDQKKKFGEEIKGLKRTIEEKEEERRKIIFEREDLALKMSKLEKQLKTKIDSKEKSSKDSEGRLEEMMTENYDLKSRISSLEKQISTLESEQNKKGEERLKQLQSKIEKLVAEKSESLSEFEKRIQEMKQKHESEIRKMGEKDKTELKKLKEEHKKEMEAHKDSYEKKLAASNNLLGRTKMLSKTHIANIKARSTQAYQGLQNKMKQLSVAAKRGLTEKIKAIERLQNELDVKTKELDVMKEDLTSLSGNEMLERQLHTYIEKEKAWEAERKKLLEESSRKVDKEKVSSFLSEKQNEIDVLTQQVRDRSKLVTKLETEVNMLKQFHHKKELAWKTEKTILREWMKKKVSSPAGSPVGSPRTPKNSRLKNLFGRAMKEGIKKDDVKKDDKDEKEE